MGVRIIDKGGNIDVLFIAEGTYPYIKGGVSTWIHQIINGMKDINFGVLFLGSRPEDYKGIGYELPDNLVYLEATYLFEDKKGERLEKRVKESEKVRLLGAFLEDEKFENAWQEVTNFNFFREVSYEDFLYSRQSWEFIEEVYENIGIDVPFVDYFWTMRNLFAPLFKVAELAMSIERKI